MFLVCKFRIHEEQEEKLSILLEDSGDFSHQPSSREIDSISPETRQSELPESVTQTPKIIREKWTAFPPLLTTIKLEQTTILEKSKKFHEKNG